MKGQGNGGKGGRGAALGGIVLLFVMILGLELFLDLVLIPLDLVLVPGELVFDVIFLFGSLSAIFRSGSSGRQLGAGGTRR